ncbi:zinc-binding dehydrogenase [Sphaerisporangium rubeum]|uniref:NADPH:quinone reductase-like Zn-dependent oxidoreductase n=1 Tax=Sphaerisporangium rubeum TaxID=321317 RepID=A0A7X0IK83_9ACTN|nr:zinc-binding dehydrogenase [Sphaerisporangium rubeum]MBB6476726.1 NADPH:quinone reductase-like Zn-dependent oxidoreductase [Sphaerisporangium rubeum]
MFAAVARRTDPADPLAALALGEWPEPHVPDGWTVVTVKAAGVNHHDLWTLRGVGVVPERLPIVLGVEAAGLDEDGREVVVYPVVGDPGAGHGDETLDPGMRLLSQEYDGTFAERVAVPARNLVPKPAGMTFEQAACLPGAWLTAYRMLFGKAALPPGSTVLVQGVGGGVSTALIMMAVAAGHRVWATSRSPRKRELARSLGVDEAYPPGARLPERVDAVMETVGAATWDHSVNAVRPGGVVVVAGATTGARPVINLSRVFYRQIGVIGSTLGTRDELVALLRFCDRTGVLPLVHQVLPLTDAAAGIAALASGDVFGKIVLTT